MSSIPTSSRIGLTLSLIGAAILIGFYFARATTSQAQQTQVRPVSASYDCDTAGAITVSREGNSDRYTYSAVNTRGETLSIPNGNSYTDGSTRVYTFTTGNSRFLIEDQGNGRARLSTSQGGGNYTTFNCTVTSSSNGSSVSPVVPALW